MGKRKSYKQVYGGGGNDNSTKKCKYSANAIERTNDQTKGFCEIQCIFFYYLKTLFTNFFHFFWKT